jgi:hypothetical protein
MKKSFALLAGTLPLVVTLAGCAQIQDAVGNITGNHSYSKNLTVDGKVDATDGSYETINVSDDFLNKAVNEGLTEGQSLVVIDNPEIGQKMSVQPQILRNKIVRYFFNEFIDSTALEGEQRPGKPGSKQSLPTILLLRQLSLGNGWTASTVRAPRC